MIYPAQDYPLDYFIVGTIFSVVGLVLIIFHRSVKEHSDYWRSRDFPVGWGEMWSGKYTKAGLILTYGAIITASLLFLVSGIALIVKAFKS